MTVDSVPSLYENRCNGEMLRIFAVTNRYKWPPLITWTRTLETLWVLVYVLCSHYKDLNWKYVSIYTIYGECVWTQKRDRAHKEGEKKKSESDQMVKISEGEWEKWANITNGHSASDGTLKDQYDVPMFCTLLCVHIRQYVIKYNAVQAAHLCTQMIISRRTVCGGGHLLSVHIFLNSHLHLSLFRHIYTIDCKPLYMTIWTS